MGDLCNAVDLYGMCAGRLCGQKVQGGIAKGEDRELSKKTENLAHCNNGGSGNYARVNWLCVLF